MITTGTDADDQTVLTHLDRVDVVQLVWNEDNHEAALVDPVHTIDHPIRVFIGNEAYNWSMDVEGGGISVYPRMFGNTILVHVSSIGGHHQYTFIGLRVVQFETVEIINTFRGVVGGNDVPYPWCISESWIYLPNDNVGVMLMRTIHSRNTTDLIARTLGEGVEVNTTSYQTYLINHSVASYLDSGDAETKIFVSSTAPPLLLSTAPPLHRSSAPPLLLSSTLITA